MGALFSSSETQVFENFKVFIKIGLPAIDNLNIIHGNI